MVFTGRKRGRGFRGGIHATTRKTSGRSGDDVDRTRNRSRDRSRSPAPGSGARGSDRQYGKGRSPTPKESLRITVGNDIYKEQSRRSPLADRLGPPVNSFESRRYSEEIDIYEEEKLYYGDSSDARRTRDDDRYRQSDRRREEYSRDRGNTYDRREGRNERDHMGRENDRYKQSPSDRYGMDRSRGNDKQSPSDRYDMDRMRGSDRRSRDRSMDRHSLDEFSRSPQRFMENYNRGDFPSRRSPQRPLEGTRVIPTPEAKPLKSILKKKAPVTEQSYQEPLKNVDPYRENVLFPSASLASLPQGTRLQGQEPAPKLVPYMDIDDEERFLYGDGEAEPAQGGRGRPGLWEDPSKRHPDHRFGTESYPPQVAKRNELYPPDNYFQQQQSQQQTRSTFPILGQQLPDNGAPSQNYTSQTSYTQQQPAHKEPTVETKPLTPDLLSIFTNKPTLTLGTSVKHEEEQRTEVKSEKPENYDPTIENILKSIGFDFEMSKRMQEKAQNTTPKPKDEPQFGINQTASFLEGGLSADDLKEKLFKKKEVDVENFLREVKEQSGKDVPDRRGREEIHSYNEREDKSDQSNRIRRDSLVDQFLNMDSVFDLKKSKHFTGASGLDINKSTTKSAETPSPTSLNYASASSFPPQTSSFPPQTSSFQPPTTMYQTSTNPYQPPISDPIATGQTYNLPTTQVSQYPQYQYPQYGTAASYTGATPTVSHPYSSVPSTTPSYAYTGPPEGYAVSQYPNYPVSQTPATYTKVMQTSPTDTKTIKRTITNLREVPMSQNKQNVVVDVLHKSEKDTKIKKTENKRSNLVEIPKTNIPLSKMSAKSKEEDTRNESHSGIYRTVLPPKIDTSKNVSERDRNFSKSVGKDSLKRSAPEDSETRNKSFSITPRQKERLLREKEERQKRIGALEEELDKLKRQQNEIMRKKRRQKDGHKDPILLQNSKLQEEIALQISKLRKVTEENSKQLGTGIPAPDKGPAAKKPKQNGDDLDSRKDDSKESKTKKESPSTESEERKPKQLSFQVKTEPKVRYEFFDRGSHWCSTCNNVFSSVLLYLEHQHTQQHWKSSNMYDRPWMPEELMNPAPKKKAKKVEVEAIKGPEFLMPVKGYYCSLCKEFCGDEVCGEFHLKTDTHYNNYQEFLKKNMFYEQRRKLDKATGIAQKQESEREKSQREKKELRDKLKTQKNQVLDQLIKDKIKLSEKPVQELPDMDETPRTVAKQAKIKLSLKKPIDDKNSSEKSEPSNTVPQEKVEENPEDSSKKEEAKKGISIKISNKIGIVGKVPTKKNPLLAPWTPVSKQEIQKPPTVEKFLGMEGGKTKSIPLVNTKKPMVTAQDILNAFTGKSKDTNSEAKEDEENAIEFGPHFEAIKPKEIEMDNAEVKIEIPNPEATSEFSHVIISEDKLPPAEGTVCKMSSVPTQDKLFTEDTNTAESPVMSSENIEVAGVVGNLTSAIPEEVPSLGSNVKPATAVNYGEEKSMDIVESKNIEINLKSRGETNIEVSEKQEVDMKSSVCAISEEICSKSETNETVQYNQNDSCRDLTTPVDMELEDDEDDAQKTVEKPEDTKQLSTIEIDLNDIALPPDDPKADSDAESDASGCSMNIGDFEVIDECEED